MVRSQISMALETSLRSCFLDQLESEVLPGQEGRVESEAAVPQAPLQWLPPRI